MQKLKRVGFWSRFWAYILDEIFLAIVIGLITGAVMAAGIVTTTQGAEPYYIAGFSVMTIAITLFYFTAMEGKRGQTLGKMAIGIIVLSERGKKITYGQAFLRRIGLLIPFFNIIDALCILRRSRQRIFDNAARTIVVEVEE